jgi:hypothetical protein
MKPTPAPKVERLTDDAPARLPNRAKAGVQRRASSTLNARQFRLLVRRRRPFFDPLIIDPALSDTALRRKCFPKLAGPSDSPRNSRYLTFLLLVRPA